MTVLRHKDFQGSVDFVDGHLLLQILHIDDVITTEGRQSVGGSRRIRGARRRLSVYLRGDGHRALQTVQGLVQRPCHS